MGKTITVASKFTEEENEKIEVYAEVHNMSKSQVLHEFVIRGMKDNHTTDAGVRTVSFYFTDDYAFFWKHKTYQGTINGDTASIKFGGEWKHYNINDLPVEVQY